MKISTRTGILLAAAVLAASCSKTEDLYDPNIANGINGQQTQKAEPNTFDFSTSQQVTLNVDYSAENVVGAVFFSVYSENPLTVTTAEDGYEHTSLKEGLTPIYENYTGSNGKFSRTITLPSFAQHLYVLTGDFTIKQTLMEADVTGGKASAVATKTAASRITRAGTADKGVSTNDLSTLWNIAYMDNNGNKGTQVFPDWVTPLGTWDNLCGRPDYVNQNVSENLKFTEEEYTNIFDAATRALNVNKQCSDELITQADLEIIKDSEVGITMLGGVTCWNSSMGYYYYTGDVPSKENLHIVMLFPNTQDGNWNHDGGKDVYNGNIGVQRGDVVQLIYYPNIAQGSLEGATKTFPKGTKIGFILKTNGWGMQQGSKNFSIQPNWASRRYNSWSASTDGLSYFVRGNTPGIYYENPTGASRMAKFQCTTENNHTYAIVSFEDAYDDRNYSDVVFALKPMDAFMKLPDPEDKTTEVHGVYCFEDLWPSKGDYDLNDAVVAFKQTKTLRKPFDQKTFKMVKEVISLTTYQNYVTLKSGLAMTVDTKATPTEVVMKKVKDGKETEVSFTKEDNVYLLTDNIMGEIGTEYLLELYYENGVEDNQCATVKPFIYRNTANYKRLEVHIVGEAPTSKVDTSFFGTQDDCSDPAKGLYYVRAGNYPFAIYLENATASDVAKILERSNESKAIDQLYSGYLDWVTSNGSRNTGWYK